VFPKCCSYLYFTFSTNRYSRIITMPFVNKANLNKTFFLQFKLVPLHMGICTSDPMWGIFLSRFHYTWVFVHQIQCGGFFFLKPLLENAFYLLFFSLFPALLTSELSESTSQLLLHENQNQPSCNSELSFFQPDLHFAEQ